jgi:2'-5' RNA ligase
MTLENPPLRAFIAIALSEDVCRRLDEFQHQWQAELRANFVRWTPAEQIHLTLHFLGNVPARSVPELEAALRRACGGVRSFELAVVGSGCFPNDRAPRVLWVGVGGELAKLTELQARVVRETRARGEANAREFRPHLTIGRVKDISGWARREAGRSAHPGCCVELGRWTVGNVLLMRSELAPAGARHMELARCSLLA